MLHASSCFYISVFLFKLLDDDYSNELFDEDEEEEEEIPYSVEEQLTMVVDYLRTEHIYCIFCAIR